MQNKIILYTMLNFLIIATVTNVKFVFQVNDRKNDSTDEIVSENTFKNEPIFYLNDIEKYPLRFRKFYVSPSETHQEIILYMEGIYYPGFLIFYYYLKTCYLPQQNFSYHTFISILYFLDHFEVEFDINITNIIQNLLFNLSFIKIDFENISNDMKVRFNISDNRSFRLFMFIFKVIRFSYMSEINGFMKFLYAQACAFKLKENDFITTDVKNRILRIGNAYYIPHYDKLLLQIRDN
ncbi:hypothetical protein CWI36_0418p0020 [Hamiltosporidium magnivora]|uniref:Uncharacterized protein n=1 Tax=Hamiltosporidium magnivora TaxID=148818 RepID=A0A4Q9LF17_9MICR|nr:hypothetical protein CWI36_0418p0020 [Hamiltosporidium magnivora]